ncbi:MAG: hypothetical protein LKG19_00990 [Saprospiraceae bacterium]|jgi:hypothetical protein|nr:hypothetical protein [Saprospiraceae bacterium]
MENERLKKLKSELIWAATRQGAFQRSNIYLNGQINNDKKRAFREFIKKFLFDNIFKKHYKTKINEEQLYNLIADLQKHSQLNFNEILKGGELRFGNAQKVINLYLKSMWIAEWLDIPPHFPVDRIIQNIMGTILPWTNMDKAGYNSIIVKAQKLMLADGYTELAEWEAIKYFENYLARRI